MSEKVKLSSSLLSKESPEVRKVQFSAKAGMTQAEAIERNIIGELRDSEDGDDREEDSQV